jgi:hypothetical protein
MTRDHAGNQPKPPGGTRQANQDQLTLSGIASGSRDAYELRFTLPQRLEAWIGESEKYQRRRISAVKHDFLSEIMIYYQLDGGVRACQLGYEPSQLVRR